MLRCTIPDSIFTRYTIDVANGTAFDKKRNLVVRARKSEYTSIMFEGKAYPLHRVIYFAKTGKQPHIVDHIDRNTKNNCGDNLRGFDKHNEFANIANQTRRAKYIHATKLFGELQLLATEKERRNYAYHMKRLLDT